MAIDMETLNGWFKNLYINMMWPTERQIFHQFYWDSVDAKVTKKVISSPPTKKHRIMKANAQSWTEDLFSELNEPTA